MKRKRSGLIPEKAQLPVAIGGAILLVLIVLWRFVLPLLKASDSAAAPPPAPATGAPAADVAPISEAPATAAVAVATDDLTALQELVAVLEQRLAPKLAAATQPPELVANPFSPLAAGDAPQLNDEEAAALEEQNGFASVEETAIQELPMAPSPEELERMDRLGSLRLTGTLRSGGWAMAVINGGYYRSGDEVEGFTVVEIAEKQVKLKDAVGSELLHLESQPESGGPRLTLPAPAPATPQPLPQSPSEPLETTTPGENAS